MIKYLYLVISMFFVSLVVNTEIRLKTVYSLNDPEEGCFSTRCYGRVIASNNSYIVL